MRLPRTTEAQFSSRRATEGLRATEEQGEQWLAQDSCVHLRLVCEPAMRQVAESAAQLAESAASALGFALVRLQLTGGRKPRLQVLAERSDGSFSLDDCATLSRKLSAQLDAQDEAGNASGKAIQSAYVLEVSSPGMERPLTRPQDFTAYAGRLVHLRLNRFAQQKRKKYLGTLIGVEGIGLEGIRPEGENLILQIQEDETTLKIPLAQIAEVHLHLASPRQTKTQTKTHGKAKAKNTKGKNKKSSLLANLSSKPIAPHPNSKTNRVAP